MPRVAIEFLSRNSASAFITDDPDGYIRSLFPTDLLARGAQSAQAYAFESAADMLDPLPSERATVMDALKVVQFRQFPLPPRVAIAVFGNRYEEGLPHTRMGIVFLPRSALSRSGPRLLARLLHHELIHISQRHFPEFTAAMLEARGFRKLRRVTQEDNVRANPDTDGFLYSNSDPEIYTSRTPTSIRQSTGRHPFEIIADSNSN